MIRQFHLWFHSRRRAYKTNCKHCRSTLNYFEQSEKVIRVSNRWKKLKARLKHLFFKKHTHYDMKMAGMDAGATEVLIYDVTKCYGCDFHDIRFSHSDPLIESEDDQRENWNSYWEDKGRNYD